MTEKQSKTTADSYELDLDDTISDWSKVVEDAMAVVGEGDGTNVKDEVKAARPSPSEARSSREEAGKAVEILEPEATETPAGEEDGKAAPEPVPPEPVPPEPVPAAAAEALAREIVLTARYERLEAEAQGLRERLLRTVADLESFRKRAEREKEQIERFALFDALKDFLGVFDNLERALAASGSAEDLKKGVDMIARQFYDLLRRYGVARVEAVGQPFDPTVHEAVTRQEGADADQPMVTAEWQPGYLLHDRLLRPSMVTVAMPAPKPDPPPAEPEPAGDEAVGEEAAGEEAAGDEAAGEEAAGDEAAGEEATIDELTAAGSPAAGEQAAGEEARQSVDD